MATSYRLEVFEGDRLVAAHQVSSEAAVWPEVEKAATNHSARRNVRIKVRDLAGDLVVQTSGLATLMARWRRSERVLERQTLAEVLRGNLGLTGTKSPATAAPVRLSRFCWTASRASSA